MRCLIHHVLTVYNQQQVQVTLNICAWRANLIRHLARTKRPLHVGRCPLPDPLIAFTTSSDMRSALTGHCFPPYFCYVFWYKINVYNEVPPIMSKCDSDDAFITLYKVDITKP